MTKLLFNIFLLIAFIVPSADGQIQLSPVNTGDCVCARIETEKTDFVKELDKRYCIKRNKDKEKQRKCIENSKGTSYFSFFTDRGSEGEYYIGINGNEITLQRMTKQPGKPIDFIGSFTGKGIRVNIDHARLESEEHEPKSEGGALIAATYKVDVTVTIGKVSKTFKDMGLSYGF